MGSLDTIGFMETIHYKAAAAEPRHPPASREAAELLANDRRWPAAIPNGYLTACLYCCTCSGGGAPANFNFTL
jgi:hypothetical protein